MDKQNSYNHEFARINSVIDNNFRSQYTLFQPIVEHKLNIITIKKETKASLATFLQCACFYPVKSIFLKALKKNTFTTWPELTIDLVRIHLVPNITTTFGNQRYDKHSLQSTKILFWKNLTDIKNKIKNWQKKRTTQSQH